jgi:hypothetical protein
MTSAPSIPHQIGFTIAFKNGSILNYLAHKKVRNKLLRKITSDLVTDTLYDLYSTRLSFNSEYQINQKGCRWNCTREKNP